MKNIAIGVFVAIGIFLLGFYSGCNSVKPETIIEYMQPDTVVLTSVVEKPVSKTIVKTVLKEVVKLDTVFQKSDTVFQEVETNVLEYIYQSEYVNAVVHDTITVYDSEILSKRQGLELTAVEKVVEKEYKRIYGGISTMTDFKTGNAFLGLSYMDENKYIYGLHKSVLDKAILVNVQIPLFKWR